MLEVAVILLTIVVCFIIFKLYEEGYFHDLHYLFIDILGPWILGLGIFAIVVAVLCFWWREALGVLFYVVLYQACKGEKQS